MESLSPSIDKAIAAAMRSLSSTSAILPGSLPISYAPHECSPGLHNCGDHRAAQVYTPARPVTTFVGSVSSGPAIGVTFSGSST